MLCLSQHWHENIEYLRSWQILAKRSYRQVKESEQRAFSWMLRLLWLQRLESESKDLRVLLCLASHDSPLKDETDPD
jgi:hypothetical protein